MNFKGTNFVVTRQSVARLVGGDCQMGLGDMRLGTLGLGGMDLWAAQAAFIRLYYEKFRLVPPDFVIDWYLEPFTTYSDLFSAAKSIPYSAAR